MSQSNGRILYVEDNEDNRKVITAMMQAWGYEITSVATVTEGLSLARQGRFDVYLLDYRLPDGNGIELCRRIRGFDAHTPIIFYSASAYPNDVDEALAAGAQVYITKPGNFVELEMEIAGLIGKNLSLKT